MIHAFVDFVNGGVRIAIVGDVIALIPLVQIIVARRRIMAVILESSVASVRHRIVVIGAILIHDLSISLELPERVLRVDRSSVVGIRVAVLGVGHVNTCGRSCGPSSAHSDASADAHRVAVAVVSGVEGVFTRIVHGRCVQTGVAPSVLQSGVVRRRWRLLRRQRRAGSTAVAAQRTTDNRLAIAF